MNKAALLAEIMRLPPDERIDLIGDLWDRLESSHLPPLTDDQIKELDRIPWTNSERSFGPTPECWTR